MEKYRIEHDSLGEKEIPCDALYGIHTVRALENFPGKEVFHFEWFKAVGRVKMAVYQSVERFQEALEEKNSHLVLPFPLPAKSTLKALLQAATEIAEGQWYSSCLVPALTGGAGTSQHMNINEIITNRALQIMRHAPGNYSIADPLADANIFQSTNDVMLTALHVAAMFRLKKLEQAVNTLRVETEQKESRYRYVLRLAYTQMQEAVPSSWGKLFSNYSEAFSRDWWRVSKTFERIKVVNIGGGATGTSLSVPRFYLMEVARTLQRVTGLPVTRSENLTDATANHDVLVEVHAILKSLAVNLEKLASDLRLLSSGLARQQVLTLPALQMGSSIMPGKINPVVPEYIISGAHKIYANDNLIATLAGQGCLDLNAYLPAMGHALLESLDILINLCTVSADKLIHGLVVDQENSEAQVYFSPSITSALNPIIGYHKAAELAHFMQKNAVTVFAANEKLNILDPVRLQEIMQPEKLLQAGFVINDITLKSEQDDKR
ncbi:MAG: lyase family protein [Bacteroidales bacterium]|nr:lyase family protein [Bacteroidales bacterium]